MQERNFIVFINPISGTKNKGAIRSLIEKELTEKNLHFQVLPTERSGNYDFLKEKIAAEKITDVIICGGDGTVNQVCSYLRNINVNAGIIPMGSGNGLAFAAGIPRSHKKALAIIFKGKASYIDSFLINNKFSCMLCGLGFDAQVAHDFAKQSTRGLSTYIKLSLNNFLKNVFYPFVINANGHEIKADAFFISIANSNQFGNNFTIAPKANLSDGLLDIILVKKTGRINLALKLLKQIHSGKVVTADVQKNTVHYFQAKELTIQNPGKAPFHIDGEPTETSERFEIKIIEKAFRLLQP